MNPHGLTRTHGAFDKSPSNMLLNKMRHCRNSSPARSPRHPDAAGVVDFGIYRMKSPVAFTTGPKDQQCNHLLARTLAFPVDSRNRNLLQAGMFLGASVLVGVPPLAQDSAWPSPGSPGTDENRHAHHFQQFRVPWIKRNN